MGRPRKRCRSPLAGCFNRQRLDAPVCATGIRKAESTLQVTRLRSPLAMSSEGRLERQVDQRSSVALVAQVQAALRFESAITAHALRRQFAARTRRPRARPSCVRHGCSACASSGCSSAACRLASTPGRPAPCRTAESTPDRGCTNTRPHAAECVGDAAGMLARRRHRNSSACSGVRS